MTVFEAFFPAQDEVAVKIVLVVEDEVAVRDALVKALSDAGHLAAAAAGLKEARAAMLGRQEVAMRLPRIFGSKDGDGLDLLRELPALASITDDSPVIVATAYGDSQRTIEAMRDGAFEYLTKPFDLPLSLATVDRAARRPEAARRTRFPGPRSQAAPRRGRASRRLQRSDARGVESDRAGRRVRRPRAHHRRDRDGQGARRAGDPRLLVTFGQSHSSR